MARVKVCGVCWKPVAECICDDEPEDDGKDCAA
jgi:hypothetical protein